MKFIDQKICRQNGFFNTRFSNPLYNLDIIEVDIFISFFLKSLRGSWDDNNNVY